MVSMLLEYRITNGITNKFCCLDISDKLVSIVVLCENDGKKHVQKNIFFKQKCDYNF